jgi:hypothetical protein
MYNFNDAGRRQPLRARPSHQDRPGPLRVRGHPSLLRWERPHGAPPDDDPAPLPGTAPGRHRGG